MMRIRSNGRAASNFSSASEEVSYRPLVDWVENNDAPASLVPNSANNTASLPVSPYPQKAHYNGTGSITAATSYTCN